MPDADHAASHVTVGAGLADGTLIGKRSQAPGLDLEVLCVRGGIGTPSVERTAVGLRERNKLLASD
jgi:hypothetical protein